MFIELIDQILTVCKKHVIDPQDTKIIDGVLSHSSLASSILGGMDCIQIDSTLLPFVFVNISDNGAAGGTC